MVDNDAIKIFTPGICAADHQLLLRLKLFRVQHKCCTEINIAFNIYTRALHGVARRRTPDEKLYG